VGDIDGAQKSEERKWGSDHSCAGKLGEGLTKGKIKEKHEDVTAANMLGHSKYIKEETKEGKKSN